MIRFFTCFIATVLALPAIAGAGAPLQRASALAKASPTAASEVELGHLVAAMAQQVPDDEMRALVTELALREPQVFVAHEEGPALVPLVDVGAAARSTLRAWKRVAARDLFAAAWRGRAATSLDDYFVGTQTQREGFIEALELTPPARLLALRDEVLARFHEPGGDRLAAALGRRLGDAGLLQRTVDDGASPVAQALVRSAHELADSALRLAVLESALEREDLASLALFAIARSADAKSDSLIWDKLHDPVLGATAAAILARRADAATLGRLREMLAADLPLATRQRAALALALSDDVEAQRAAHAWRQAQ